MTKFISLLSQSKAWIMYDGNKFIWKIWTGRWKKYRHGTRFARHSDQDPITRVAPPVGWVLIFDLAELKEITKYRGGHVNIVALKSSRLPSESINYCKNIYFSGPAFSAPKVDQRSGRGH